MSEATDLRPIVDHLTARFGELVPVGVGGMARVYRGQDPDRKIPVAIKVMLPDAAARGHLRTRFLREMRLLKEWSHPNLIRVFDTREVPFLWFSMEFLDGANLHHHIRRMGALPWEEAVGILEDLLSALAYIHAQGYVHRDVKPANVILDGSGRARLCDLGLVGHPEPSGLTKMGQMMGTFQYMSPELISGHPVREPGDLFGAGLVLFELLTGGPYFKLVADGQLREPVRPLDEALDPDLPAELRGLLETLLAMDPTDRFATASDALRAVRDLGEIRREKARFESLLELATLDLATLGPLAEALGFLDRLSPKQRQLYLQDPDNLQELRLHAWEVRQRTRRFEGLDDESSVAGVEAWKALAAELDGELAPLVDEVDLGQLDRAVDAVEMTQTALRLALKWARLEPLDEIYPAVARELKDGLRLALPEEDVPVYAGGDLAAARLRVSGLLTRLLKACVRDKGWVSLFLQHRVEGLHWILEVKGRDLSLTVERAHAALGMDAEEIQVAAGATGGLVLTMPAVWSPV